MWVTKNEPTPIPITVKTLSISLVRPRKGIKSLTMVAVVIIATVAEPMAERMQPHRTIGIKIPKPDKLKWVLIIVAIPVACSTEPKDQLAPMIKIMVAQSFKDFPKTPVSDSSLRSHFGSKNKDARAPTNNATAGLPRIRKIST